MGMCYVGYILCAWQDIEYQNLETFYSFIYLYIYLYIYVAPRDSLDHVLERTEVH